MSQCHQRRDRRTPSRSLLLAVALDRGLEVEILESYGALLLPLVGVMMTVVGLLATIGPARRGLSIQPTEALREE